MSVSSYTFQAPEKLYSQEFFDDLGNYPEFVHQEKKITNYYKTYAWIQEGDSFLRVVAKIAFAILTFTASLWVTVLLDWWIQDQRQVAFDAAIAKKKEGYFKQTITDLFRQTIYLGDQNLYERGWDALSDEKIPEAHRRMRSTYKTFGELRKYAGEHPEEKDFIEAQDAFYKLIKEKVIATILPEIFRDLQEKYGTLRALQVMDSFSQVISVKMFNELGKEYLLGRLTPTEGEGPLASGCVLTGNNPAHEVTQLKIKNGQLILEREMFLYPIFVHPTEKRVLARIQLDFVMELSSFTGRSMITITPNGEELTLEEAQKLNDVWKDFGFKMPLPQPQTV